MLSFETETGDIVIEKPVTDKAFKALFCMTKFTLRIDSSTMRVLVTSHTIVVGYPAEFLEIPAVYSGFFMTGCTIHIRVHASKWKVRLFVIECRSRAKCLKIMTGCTIV